MGNKLPLIITAVSGLAVLLGLVMWFRNRSRTLTREILTSLRSAEELDAVQIDDHIGEILHRYHAIEDVCALLRKLCAVGYVISREGKPLIPDGGSPHRSYYRLTQSGEEYLRQLKGKS